MISATQDNSGNSVRPRVAVQAVIYSPSLAAEEISSRLNLSPSKTTEKGVKLGRRTGTQVEVPRHMWQLSSESHVTTFDLADHLDWILSNLFRARDQLAALRDSGEIECVLTGVIWTSGTSAHVRLATRHMELLLKLALDLQLEFADYGDDD